MGFDINVVLEGLKIVLQPMTLIMITIGTIGGILMGIIPGLTATLAVALLIPFTFHMEPQVALSLLVVVYVGGISGGCMTAILIRMPGTPASVATLIDGFPLTQRGLGGFAIGNAVVASFFGTIISGILLIIMAPLLANFALKFFYAEYVAVCTFALTAVISITGKSIARGLVTCLLGMLAATFGISEVDGLPRFTLGMNSMAGGFGLMPVLIGLYAVSQMMQEISRSDIIDKSNIRALGRVLPSIKTVGNNLVNYFRSGLIGTFVGIVPAVGAVPAALISYAQAKNASKTPQECGTGKIEGVIAAETANNATIGGALIIALTLGIPGDPVTAILIGGLMIHGLQPGPQLFMNNPDIVYSIYFSVFFGALTMMVTMLLAARILAKVVEVPKEILIPILFVVAATGIFSLNSRVFDVIILCIFGLIGYIFDRYRYPMAPFILGYLLGPLIEMNLRQLVEMQGHAYDLFTRPISVTFLAVSGIFLAYSLYKHKKE
jgi:putative tricarboxylic transport membrane protein